MDYQKLFDMTGKVWIVTGGTGYLGSANVNALKDFGATVVIASHRPPEARGDKPAYDFHYDLFVQCNVSDTESVRACFQKVYDTYGRIDVLVSCANGTGIKKNSKDILEMDDASFANGIDRCVCVTHRCIREVTPFMEKNGGGSIINYSSMYGLVSPDLHVYENGCENHMQVPDYGASKAAVVQLTRFAAGVLAKKNIRVNCVTPGPFPEPRHQDPEFVPRLANKTMLGRVGVNHEMSGAVLLLASDAGSFMTGTNIVVDGGWTAW